MNVRYPCEDDQPISEDDLIILGDPVKSVRHPCDWLWNGCEECLRMF